MRNLWETFPQPGSDQADIDWKKANQAKDLLEARRIVRDFGRSKGFAQLNSRHQVKRSVFFSLYDFRQRIGINPDIGLCSGLVQVWWAELRKGNDPMKSLKAATPSVMRRVLLSQVRSIRLKQFPAVNGELSTSEEALLKFKYGDATISRIYSLQKMFDVSCELELDLILHHGSPIMKKYEFLDRDTELLHAVCNSTHPGLYLFLFSGVDSNQQLGQNGHRSAMAVHAGGECCFFDPRMGETSFSTVHHFASWFSEHLNAQRWNLHLVRMYALGGRFSPEVNAERIAFERRFWNSAPRMQ